MICKVKRTIDRYGLFKDVKSVAVGVSGGADSMCLINILSSLKDEYGIILKAVHLNHNLRGQEALRDEKLVRDFCREKNIELLVFSEDIRKQAHLMRIGEEECGRIFRYECFNKAECDAVATAHTLSDSMETFVFNLLRGTGSKGLCGIPAKREPNIIRPLIDCTREEIEEYCRINSVPFIIDSTNLSDDYKRNYIRHNIIPAFENVNPSFSSSIGRALGILKEENDFVEECALKLIKESRCEKGYSSVNFSAAHPAVVKRAIAIILNEKMDKPFESRHVELVFEAVQKGEGKIKIADDLYISVKRSIIFFSGEDAQSERWLIPFERDTAVTPHGTFKIVSATENDKDAFDMAKVKSGLLIGSRKEGDSFTFKSRNLTKSLKKLFNEMKMPISERNKIAVLRDGERVVWVEGVGVNAEYEPNENSEKLCLIKKEG